LGLKVRKEIKVIVEILALAAVMVLMGCLANLAYRVRRAREDLRENLVNWDDLGVMEQRERLVHYLSTSGEILP
jgi:hypothetical protein